MMQNERIISICPLSRQLDAIFRNENGKKFTSPIHCFALVEVTEDTGEVFSEVRPMLMDGGVLSDMIVDAENFEGFKEG